MRARENETSYRTTNWAQYNKALKMRGSLTVWFDKAMQWEAEPSGKRGRQQVFSDAAIQFCLSIKVLFQLALRHCTGLAQSLLKLSGLDWTAPDFSTLCRRQAQLQVNIGYTASKAPGLHLLVDSTGIQFLGEGEWKRRTHGVGYRRQWRKVHLGVDAQTLQIRAVEVTDNETGDAPMLPLLLEQIPMDEPIARVTADGAYDTFECHEAIAQRQAQAIIPPRQNAQPCEAKSAGRAVRNDAVAACAHLGPKVWKTWSGYHRRSLVETKMHCFKRLGQRVVARTFDRQVVELHVRVAILNCFTQLGCPQTVVVPVVA